MRGVSKSKAISWAVFFSAVTFLGTSRADDAVHWETNLDAAKRAAAETNRLVLVHFWAPWCGPCMRLESTVFSQPGVARDMEARFVPVKLNADDWPATARNFAIERLPTDVVMTPNGRVLYKLGCPQDPNQYVTQLSHAATIAQGIATAPPAAQRPFVAAQAPTVPLSPAGTPYAAPVVAPVAMAPNVAPPSFGVPNAAVPNVVVPNPIAATRPTIAPAGPQIIRAPSARPTETQPLGLDGFCPVTLVERSRTAPDDPRCWIRGDPRWGAVHRGVTYLFNGPDEQKRFLANPDRYAPALGGNDAVLAFDRAKLIRGHREFGTFCESRIYLFAGKETLDAFQKDPRRYVEEVRQAENPPHAAVR